MVMVLYGERTAVMVEFGAKKGNSEPEPRC